MFIRYNVSLTSHEIVTIGARGLFRHIRLCNSVEHGKRIIQEIGKIKHSLR
jgi:hypothetical protein